MRKDPTAFRERFKKWKETGEYELPRFEDGIEGQSIFLKVNNYIPRAKAKVLQAKTKAIPLKYIGGNPEQARAEFWRQEPVLQHAVDSVAQRYGVDPEVVKYRINHEGFVDHYIQDRNKAIKRGNQNFIPRGYRILNDFVPNGAGVSEFGLDDYGTYLEEGKIQLTGKQLYERPNGFEYMTPQYYVGFSRDGQAYTNEKGRQTNPATGWDNATNFGMVAAGLKYFKDKAREDFPNASDKDLNRYSLAYFNRGETGGRKWVKSGAKGYNLPKYELGIEGDDIELLIRKRLEQRSDNTSVQRQEPMQPIKRNFIAESQRKHAAEAVGPDTRSSYQRKQSLAAKLYANQQYQKAKDDVKRAEGFENLMKLSRPSTYVEAATGLDLGVAGRLATDVVAFGLPGLLKHGAAKVATSPAMQYVRYPIGKIRFGFDAQLPTLYRKVKTLPTIENGVIKISTPQNRFAFENGYGEESPLITNFTTDAPVRSHSAGNWDRGVTLAIPGKKLLGKNVISTRPSDTFTYGNDIQVNIGDVTAITGRQKEIDFLTNHGINTISSDKLKSKFAEDAVKYMQDIAKVRATYPRVFGQKGIVLLKPKTPIEDFSNYAAEVENVSRDFFTSPTLKDYKFMDYVFHPKYTSETMPMYNVSSLESLNQAPQLGEWLGEDTKRMYLLDTNRWKNVMYDPSTPVESLFRQGLNIGLKPEYRK